MHQMPPEPPDDQAGSDLPPPPPAAPSAPPSGDPGAAPTDPGLAPSYAPPPPAPAAEPLATPPPAAPPVPGMSTYNPVSDPHAPAPAAAVGPSEGEFEIDNPSTFVSTLQKIVTDPAGFYRDIRPEGPLANPLVFALICYLIGGILTALLDENVGIVGGLFTAAFSATIGLFIGAGILHLLIMLVVPNNGSYTTTFRMLGYASVTQLIAWVSAINLWLGIVPAVLGLVLLFYGIRGMHRTTSDKAGIVVGIIVALLVILVFIGGNAVTNMN